MTPAGRRRHLAAVAGREHVVPSPDIRRRGAGRWRGGSSFENPPSQNTNACAYSRNQRQVGGTAQPACANGRPITSLMTGSLQRREGAANLTHGGTTVG